MVLIRGILHPEVAYCSYSDSNNTPNLSIYVLFRLKDNDTRLMLWDTAGQEEFDAITKAYYRGKLRQCIKSELHR